MTVKDKIYSRYRIQIFLITWLMYAGYYLTRKSFSVAKIAILDDSNILISKEILGAIDGAYGIAYATGQFFWGILADRIGTRKVILGSVLISVFAAVGMGMSSSALFFGFFFFMQGLVQSSGWAPLTKNVSYWFSVRERGRVYGWWCTNYAVGGLVASPFAAYMAVQVFDNWRWAFYAPAIILTAIWILFYFFQIDKPENINLPPVEKEKILNLSEEKNDGSKWLNIINVIKNPVVLTLGIVYLLLKPTRYAILFWGPVIISQRIGSGMEESVYVSTAFELAGIFGTLAAGYISDKLFGAKRIPVTVIGLTVLSVVLFFFYQLTEGCTPYLMFVIFFVIGLLLYGPDSIISGTAAVDFGTKKGAATAAGIINGCGSIGAIMGMSLPGYVSTEILFYYFAGSSLLGAIILLPYWNRVPKSN